LFGPILKTHVTVILGIVAAAVDAEGPEDRHPGAFLDSMYWLTVASPAATTAAIAEGLPASF